MTKTIVLGVGKIGVSIAGSLADAGDYNVTLADGDAQVLAARGRDDVEKIVLDAADGEALSQGLDSFDVVVSALPYFLNVTVAEAAKARGVHYFDLTEDVRVARKVMALAEGAGGVFVPQCGLAPGFISIVANHLVKGFDTPHDVRLRVGALPQFPDNSLKYNLTWSTDGLINEYCNPCEAIHDGQRRELLPLEGLEGFPLTASTTKPSARRAASAPCANPLTERCATSTKRPCAIPGAGTWCRCWPATSRCASTATNSKNLSSTASPSPARMWC